MHRTGLLILVIGIFGSSLASAEVELSDDGGSKKPGFVYIEPSNVNLEKIDGEYHLRPYLERRGHWGVTASLAYSTYEPTKYEPSFVTATFGEVYHEPSMPMLEFQFQVKRNLSFGSIAGEFAVGSYSAQSVVDVNLADSTLSVIPIRLGMNIALDALRPEPFVVPYFSLGAYTIIYKESQASAAKNGNTQLAPYANLGVQFQLDWIDRRAARIAYEDSGLEATYLFIDARKQMSSSKSTDPDFSNDVSFGTGIRVEF